MAEEQIPESWVGKSVTIWARAEGHQFEDAHGRMVPGYNQAIGEFSGRLESVNDLGASLAMKDGHLAFFPWYSVARIMLATQ
ncbi:MAG: hypothetical protein LC751_10895 [Actinobacteria bacterium]|nr:hypothetical protein [Actinomycetota bacterium]